MTEQPIDPTILARFTTPGKPSVLTSRRFWTVVITSFTNLVTILVMILVLDPQWQKLAFAFMTTITSIAGVYITLITVDDINYDKMQAYIQIERLKGK